VGSGERDRRACRLAGAGRRASRAGRRLGINEHSYLHNYQFVMMVVFLYARTALHVANDRTAESLAAYFAEPSLA
jgi:hypothetical protein